MSNFTRNFGIEMEFAGISKSESCEALRAAGIPAEMEGYNHIDHHDDVWKIVTDASVRGGHEVVSPILHGAEGLEIAKRAAKALEAAGATINTTCGLHVHFDAANLSTEELRTICKRYARHEEEIDSFMPASRRGNANTYCESVRSLFLNNRAFDRATTKIKLVESIHSRYYKVNLQAYARHHTIEFRQHSGSVDAEKIANWVLFLNAFIDESIARAYGEACTFSLENLQPRQRTLIELLSGDGKTSEELQSELGLLPHSLRGALSHLRKRGVVIVSNRENGTTTYRLGGEVHSGADSLFAGVDEAIATFYKERAARFAA